MLVAVPLQQRPDLAALGLLEVVLDGPGADAMAFERKPAQRLQLSALDVYRHEVDEGRRRGPGEQVPQGDRALVHHRRARRGQVPRPERLTDAAETSRQVKRQEPAGLAVDHLFEGLAGAPFHLRGERIDADAGPAAALQGQAVGPDVAVARADLHEEAPLGSGEHPLEDPFVLPDLRRVLGGRDGFREGEPQAGEEIEMAAAPVLEHTLDEPALPGGPDDEDADNDEDHDQGRLRHRVPPAGGAAAASSTAPVRHGLRGSGRDSPHSVSPPPRTRSSRVVRLLAVRPARTGCNAGASSNSGLNHTMALDGRSGCVA